MISTSTVRGSPIWREKEDLLASVPGVGRDCRAHHGRRTAGAWHSWPQADRVPWLASRPSRVNPASGLARRTLAVADRPCGRLSSSPLRSQSDATRSSRPSSSACMASRQVEDGRYHRCRSQAPHHPQRHPQRQKAMANRLTRDTVAEERRASARLEGWATDTCWCPPFETRPFGPLLRMRQIARRRCACPSARGSRRRRRGR